METDLSIRPHPGRAAAAAGGTRVVAVDAHPMIRWAVGRLVSESPEFTFVGEAATPHEALAIVEERQAQVTIIGLEYCEGTGFSLIRDLLIRRPEMSVIVYSALDGVPYIEHCLRLGVRAYVSKSEPVQELLHAIRQVAAGNLYLRAERYTSILSRVIRNPDSAGGPPVERLSNGEFEVFCLIGQGKSNREIATILHRSIKTVETYRSRIKDKLGLANGIELVRFAMRSMLESQERVGPGTSLPIPP